jgi:hypothetical protein
MIKNVDTKSLVIGLLIAFLVVLASGAVQNRAGGESVGRFQLVASERSDEAYVIDTATGQVWEELDGNKLNNSFFQPKLDKPSQ